MTAYKDDELNDNLNQSVEDNTEAKPNAYRVEDDNATEEKDLKGILGGEVKDANAPGMEGEGAGGHKFGEINNTPSGDDKNNPSRNAGYSNGYFARTEPSDEHPENNNFKADG